MNLRELKKEALDEAMQNLGYLRLDAFTPMLKLFLSNKDAPPRQLATEHRKRGEQLSAEEKKSLGIRANSFFSKRALAELTEKGIKNPLHAHFITLLRATLYAQNARSVRQAVEAECYELIIHGGFREECPVCARLQGNKVSANEARPQGATDCPREACGISYSPYFNDDL
jgi:hypothetical protein